MKQKTSAQSADTNGRPTVISLFSGCGGSSLGYKMAGFRELLAVDFDGLAAEVFRMNFPEVQMWERDIAEVTAGEILKACDLKKGELDVLDGSPPCQGFSEIGKRVVTDPRNNLFREFIRVVKGVGPKVFVIENVYGLTRGKMKGRFNEIVSALGELSYNVKYKLMNAMYYGVPQCRRRIIFIGTSKRLKAAPVFPERSPGIISVKEALDGCPPDTEAITPDFTCRQGRFLKKARAGELASKYDPRGWYFCSARNRLNGPSYAISTTVGKNFFTTLHPTEDRTHTIAEIKRLCSFPDDFVLTGTYRKKYKLLGNAVPPMMMRAIAEALREKVLARA